MSRVLVTGAAGFVGRALTRHLLALGFDVCAVSRRAGTIEEMVPLHGIGTIDGATDWHGLLSGVDYVVHCAARAHKLNDRNPDRMAAFRETNVAASLALARQAAAAGVRRFIFLSSIGVNGNCTIRPFTEEDVPQPVEDYARSKLEAETGLRQLATNTGMELVIIRPPLVYGPDAPGNFGRLLALAASGLPLPLGAADAPRSFVARDNLVDFISTTIMHPRAADQIFLVADGQDLSTAKMLRLIAGGLGRSPHLVTVPPTFLFWMSGLLGKRALLDRLLSPLQVDTAKARNMLDWRPLVAAEIAVQDAARQWHTRKSVQSELRRGRA